MTTRRFPPWRLLLLGGALAILVGSPQHPSGTMAEMLADPAWLPGHALTLLGFVLMLAGLAVYRRDGAQPPLTARWTRLAIAGTALQALEMAVHTAAMVDHDHLVAGRPTPVLTTHLAMATVLYPLFAITVAGLIVAGARERSLGSWWIAPLGLVGVLAHGAAAPLVILGAPEQLRILFAGIALFGLWLLLASLWPVRAAAAAQASASSSGPARTPAGAGAR